MSKRSLKELLELNIEQVEAEDAAAAGLGNYEVPSHNTEPEDPNLCCECGDQPKDLECLDCQEHFCQVCFDYIHRTGKRRQHKVEYCEPISDLISRERTDQVGRDQVDQDTLKNEAGKSDTEMDDDSEGGSEMPDTYEPEATALRAKKAHSDAAFIPMRLTIEERKLLRLLEAALEVSEYTDRVDIFMYASKPKRIVRELREICTVLTGLVVANGMDIGKVLVDGGEFSAHAEWYQSVFEVGRRYKIMNPERMRSSYGKLVYMIMDSQLPEVKQVLDFDLYKPCYTVEMHLEAHGALAMLDEPLLQTATMEIRAANKPRRAIQAEIRTKERAIEALTRKYGESVRQALYSIGDYNAYLAANRDPVLAIMRHLKADYDPDMPEDQFSLGISSGRGGSRLSHSHKRQYQYVLQSLTLWAEIMGEMFRLWKLADDDLLSPNLRYRLEDTGQGLNRVKGSPKVSRAMHNIIARAQRSTGYWVGSSVVHLGDRAVPNALFFLDKYLQVPRILNPVNTVVNLLPQTLHADRYAFEWTESQFGSIEVLQKTIITDFFRFAFDGSGADNFYDAGSCIDGRLTSAWNWANLLPKKPFYKHFLITGFVGFDGTEGF